MAGEKVSWRYSVLRCLRTAKVVVSWPVVWIPRIERLEKGLGQKRRSSVCPSRSGDATDKAHKSNGSFRARR